MLSDPIGDMITRIRNGYMAKKKEVIVSFSQLNWEILKILKQNDYIYEFSKVKMLKKGKETPFSEIKVRLVYLNGQPAIEKIHRVSTPGRRIYTKSKQIKPVLSGHGTAIISTPKGIMTGKKAQAEKLGGEVLCQIW